MRRGGHATLDGYSSFATRCMAAALRSLARVRCLAALTREERTAAVGALVLVPLVRLALWILPSRVIIRRVREMAQAPTRSSGRARPATITWATEAVSARVPGATCLTQAIAAQLLLRRHGHRSQLRLGVMRSPSGMLSAHAWLENDGRILIGGERVDGLVRLPDIAPPSMHPSELSR